MHNNNENSCLNPKKLIITVLKNSNRSQQLHTKTKFPDVCAACLRRRTTTDCVTSEQPHHNDMLCTVFCERVA